jgi:hypothetical protein
MSSQLLKKISGQLLDQQGNPFVYLPFGITIEFTTLVNTDSPGGWIGSAAVSATDGRFDLFTSYDLAVSEQVSYRILKDNIPVQSGSVIINNFVVSIQLTDLAYEELMEPDVQGYTTIKGSVTFSEGGIAAVPVTPGAVTVLVNKVLFPSNEVLDQAVLDEYGRYEVKIPNRLLQKASTKSCDEITRESIFITLFVRIEESDKLLKIGKSLTVVPEDCCTTIDIHITDNEVFDFFITELDYLLRILAEVGVSESEIHTIITDGDDTQLPALSAKTSLDEGILSVLIGAAIIANSTGIILMHTYALAKLSGLSLSVWAMMDLDTLNVVITGAHDKRIISSIGDVSSTYLKLQQYNTDIAVEEVNEDGQSIADIVGAVTSSAEEMHTFVQLCLRDNSPDTPTFWNNVALVMGNGTKDRLQRGMQILAITGMQPETSNYIQNAYSDSSLRSIAVNWTIANWKDTVDVVCDNHQKLCIPLSIRGGSEDPNDEQVKTTYSQFLIDLAQDVYATAVIGKNIERGEIPDTVISDPVQTARFINEHADLDLRIQNIWDINLESKQYTSAVRNDLMPVQNILRLAEGKPQMVTAMLQAGIKSSADVTAYTQSDFVNRFSGVSSLNGELIATQIYTKATASDLLLSHAKATIQPNNYLTGVLPSLNWSKWLNNPGPSTNPDLQTLFGSMDLCSCSECMSMYSPAAYFTDIFNMIKTRLGNPSKPYAEATRRRGDLQYIDLTCKNTNTPVPYVDLVNELLELMILKSKGITIPFQSYQTTGTAEELAAYPEHTYKNGTGTYQTYEGYETVYDNILRNQAIYPASLPFDLPLAETRTYLSHLGYKRFDLMERYKPTNYIAVPGGAEINEYNTMAEWLGISRIEADIISKTSNTNLPANDYAYYNFTNLEAATWSTILCNGEPGKGLNTLLERSSITYLELLQLLNTDFLNKPNGSGIRPLTIESSNAANPLSCLVHELRLKVNYGSAQAIFGRWYRFLRLQRVSGCSIYQLDVILTSLSIMELNTSNEFIKIVNCLQWAKQLGTDTEKIAAFWNNISTINYVNYSSDSQSKLPSLYDLLFRNKSLINPPDEAFNNPSGISGTYKDRAGTIAAAYSIKEEELFDLIQFLGIDVNIVPAPPVQLQVLSRVLGLTLLAKGNNLTIKNMLRILALGELNGVSWPAASVNSMLVIMQGAQNLIENIQGVAYSLDEIEYLLAHKDLSGNYIPTDETVQIFYEGLRSQLKKMVGDQPGIDSGSDLEKALKNVVIQYFAANFNTNGEMSSYLITEMIKVNNGAKSLLDALIDIVFINALQPLPNDPTHPLPITPGNGIPGLAFQELFDAFRKLHKVTFITNRYKLSAAELEFLYTNNVALDILDIASLPIEPNVQTNVLLQKSERLNDWTKVKGILNLRDDEFIELLQNILSPDKEDWINSVVECSGWAEENVIALVGTNTTTGILNLASGAVDFRRGALVLQINNIMQATGRIGLSPAVIYNVLRTGLIMQESGNIRKAAKSKHTEAAWLKIAKPLQDTLREQQRKALVAYVVPRYKEFIGNPSASIIEWSNENELFAYLLIDVEMKPCMMTSRIKQGINSLQLFMDRLILNLENEAGNPINHITIAPDMTEQWRLWRKWYRIWEANRKIFLYPENWIEPELRDDKTPFFKDLETQLLQDEVNDNTVEDAFMAYLEKVDEVGRLEPVSAYHETEGSGNNMTVDRIHVFSRTASLPRRYFYRRLENNEWTPWEKVNVDIKSDHVVPVMWNRRLYLFWLTFQKKKPSDEEIQEKLQAKRFTGELEWIDGVTAKTLGSIPGFPDQNRILSDTGKTGYNSWELMLNWSQYKDNKWLATEISKDIMTLDIAKAAIGSNNGSTYTSFGDFTTLKQAFEWLTNRQEIKLDEFFKNRLYLRTTFDNADLSDPNHDDNGVNFSIMFTPGTDEIATGVHAFYWRGDNSRDPLVVRAWEWGYQLMAPTGTRINKMKFIRDPKQDGKLRKDNTSFTPATMQPNYYYTFSGAQMINGKGIKRGSNNVLLNSTQANGEFTVTARASINGNPHYHFHNPMLSEFFFDDEKNTFFVQWKDVSFSAPVATQVQQGRAVSFGIAQEFANTKYGIAKQSANALQKQAPFNIMATQDPANSSAQTNLAQVALTGKYQFQTFYHAQIKQFIKALYKDGIPGLLKIENQKQDDTMHFGPLNSGDYQPTQYVSSKYPTNVVQFEFSDAYGIYNWEIFFHTPMLVAQRLSNNQQFEEAQKWYHYIFNPTSNTNINSTYTGGIERFWKFYPFYKEATTPTETLYDLLMAININDPDAVAQVHKWERNPFNPHLIARMRVLAYMKNVLMKYIDNLIAWGDQLFRRDTIESINEATQLYILAANLLGERPKEIPTRGEIVPKNFLDLMNAGLDTLSNSLVNIESFYAPNTGTPTGTTSTGAPIYGKMFYFCLPKNDKLMGYWDTVADRLFKIRNCMNIEGTTRSLPLFEPPIDPALLVRARALGVDVNSILDSAAAANLPHYRFSYMLQKASECCGEVRNLGSALLAALEKKDAEQLALLRSSQEILMLEKVKSIKEEQVSEAETTLESLKRSRENAEIRYKYYSTRTFMNSGEQKHLQSLQDGLILQAVQGGLQTAISTLAFFPQVHLQAPFALGPSSGGQQFSAALSAISGAVGIAAAINSTKGIMTVTRAGYERRMDDWTMQTDTSAKEMEQLDQQILGAEIRLAITKRELSNHELQMGQVADTDAFMRNKFTNQELYTWMSSQIAATYFQSYQLAYDLAKKTEICYQNELPLAKKPVSGFIRFGYWDSLRKGLVSGEKLQFDLRKMEASYMEENQRELELTKHFSLAMIEPSELIRLREEGTCDFSLDEVWYDLDFPGHYMRRIKSISLSLPCIAGPYTTVASSLQLNSSFVQKNPQSPVLEQVNVAVSAMATSSAQNDAGMFELNFKDERYIPFENAGAISSWSLSMMDDKRLRQIDYATISDVIIQVRYTARNDDSKAMTTKTALNDKLSAGTTGSELPRYFSLKHEFSNEWFLAFNSPLVTVPGHGAIGRTFSLDIERSHFPEYSKGKNITIAKGVFACSPKAGTIITLVHGSQVIELTPLGVEVTSLNLSIPDTEPDGTVLSFSLYKTEGSAALPIEQEDLVDLYCVLKYKLD